MKIETATSTDLLVIGYGNTLRGDDGVGPRVAETIEELRLPNVRTLVCQQLSPEHADTISRANAVIFVDASVEPLAEVRLREIQPCDSSQLMAHSADPRTMLALARDVFGRVPKAWWLTIPAAMLRFSHDFSPETTAGFEIALEKIKSLADKVCPPQGN